jgi:outer membrane receptor for ferrienterochelin and colicin
MKIFYLALLLMAFQPLLAQKNDSLILFEPSVQEIMLLPVSKKQDVTVASNLVAEQDKQPSSITTISRQQLRNCGARTLSDALTLFVPGYFAVEDQDDVIAGFRGLAADNNSKVMLLINGQNMNTEYFLGPPDAILNGQDFEYIERVEVIRGPGSVTLGQGALLGVINIITRNAASQDSGAGFSLATGQNGLFQGTAHLQTNYHGLKGFFYASAMRFEGQAIRNEGWIKDKNNEGILGGKIANMGHHLKRAESTTFHGNLQYKNLTVNLLHTGQKRDLYNFYRDRDAGEQRLSSIGIDYNFQIGSRIHNKTSLSFIHDNLTLWSLQGVAMGGTAEQRYGLKSIFTIDKLWKNNKLAVGFELRYFDMGRKNSDNNNFVANVIGTFNASTANDELTMVYSKQLQVLSLFVEDFYAIHPKIDLFAAIRYDQHPFWGNYFSPRLGLIFSPDKNSFIRFSYQTGFRGAVGLHYAGGYRRDGFLRADNYEKVNQAGIPDAQNLNPIIPESMQNFEISATYKPSEAWNLNVVSFFSYVNNVIDVGVIYRDPNQFKMIDIGSDIGGDWNGYWYFKNTPGTFAQIGLEAKVQYHSKIWDIQGSYALCKVANASDEQKILAEKANSMYLATDPSGGLNYKAFPEQVFRSYFQFTPLPKWNFSLTNLYYSAWYSPMGRKSAGGFLLNSSVSYQFNGAFNLSILAKNLTGETALYPMNSNAGSPDSSAGTPAWESRSIWAVLRLNW